MPPSLAVLTSGGDAPGMNMAVWALAHYARKQGWRVLGIHDGFLGLEQRKTSILSDVSALRWARYGGTHLGTSRMPDFANRKHTLLEALDALGVNHLVVLGGDGSLKAAATLTTSVNVLCIPATIDNDISGSDESIGFDTALNTGLQLLDGLHDTAEAIPRFFALETLGGSTGFLAQTLAEVGAADIALVPEHPLEESAIVEILREAITRKRYGILVASEGYPDLEDVVLRTSEALAMRSRFSRIGHAQRGGRPTARDRWLAVHFAEAAIACLAERQSGVVILNQGLVQHHPFSGQPLSKAFYTSSQ